MGLGSPPGSSISQYRPILSILSDANLYCLVQGRTYRQGRQEHKDWTSPRICSPLNPPITPISQHLIPTPSSRAASPTFLCECPMNIFSISNLRLVPRWGIHPLIDQQIIEKQKCLESPLAASSSLSFLEAGGNERRIKATIWPGKKRLTAAEGEIFWSIHQGGFNERLGRRLLDISLSAVRVMP